jgi:hypothetical protein
MAYSGGDGDDGLSGLFNVFGLLGGKKKKKTGPPIMCGTAKWSAKHQRWQDAKGRPMTVNCGPPPGSATYRALQPRVTLPAAVGPTAVGPLSTDGASGSPVSAGGGGVFGGGGGGGGMPDSGGVATEEVAAESPTTSAMPSWALPAALAAGAFLFLRRRK